MEIDIFIYLSLMKKILSSLLLIVLFLSQLQVWALYASEVEKLETQKDVSSQQLEAVSVVIDSAVEKLDTRMRDAEKSEQLEEKHEEINEYLEQVQQEIQNESSGEDIQELVEEAKKVVVLKVVSWVTSYEDVEDTISADVADTPDKRQAAMETIQDSLETESGEYSIIVKTSYSKKKTQSLFAKFDDDTKVVFMYESESKNYMEIFLQEDSIFRQEMLQDIESGILPETFAGIQIVLPEVYSIGEIDLKWEDLTQTWWVNHYNSYQYLDSLQENSKKITVAVIDTGIDYTHPDLQNNVNQKLGKDFVNDDDDAMDDQGHGTHVAGTIAANINGSGIIGVNPYVDLVPLKICTNRGFCPSYAVLRALEYSKENNIDILNMSLGGRGNPDGHAICQGISSYVKSGGIVVAASGNSNIDTSRFVPGWCSDAITVAAVDRSGVRAAFSNYGSKVDVSAPGVQVYSTMLGGGYKKLSGTSMAAPHIVWVVSIMQAHDTGVSSWQIKKLFTQHVSSVTSDSSSKYIAPGINLASLTASYNVEEEGIQPEEKTPEIVREESVQVEEESKEIKEEEIKEDEDMYEILLDKITYVDEEIIFIENQQQQDEAVKVANLELENAQTPSFEQMSISPASVSLDIFSGEKWVDINSVFDGEISSGSLDITYTDQAVQENNVAEKQVFGSDGTALSATQINNSGDLGESMSGSQVSSDFDFTKLSETDEIPVFDSLEINNSEEIPETQELFIDGAKQWVVINSEKEDEVKFIEVFKEDSEELQEEYITLEDGSQVLTSELEIIETEFEEVGESIEENHQEIEDIVLPSTQGFNWVEINTFQEFSEMQLELVSEEDIESIHEIDNQDIESSEIFIEEDDLPIEDSGIEINSFDDEETPWVFQESWEKMGDISSDILEEFYEEIPSDEIEGDGFGIQSVALQGDKNGLIAEYLLAWDTLDSSVHANHGVLHGATWKTATQEEARRIGQSKYLSIGKNTVNYVELPDGIVNWLHDFSMSFWVKRTDSASYYQVLNAYNNKLLLGFYGNSVAAVTNAAYGDRIPTKTKFRYRKNSWNHYTITVEWDTMKVYENGVFLASKKRVAKTIWWATGLVIGQEQDSYHGWYDANQSLAWDLANLKIHNRAVSESEAGNIFYNGDIENNSRPLWKQGRWWLVAEYLFDGNTLDTSPNNNHGVLHGSQWKQSTLAEKTLIGQDTYLRFGKNTSDYVELPDGIVNGLDDFSMSVWIKRTGISSYYPILNAFNNRILFSFWSSYAALNINASYGDNIKYNPRFITHKQSWNHYSFVVEGNMLKLYENGILVWTKQRTEKIVSDVTGIMIGQEQDTYHGKLDINQSLVSDIAKLQIYNKAISDEQAKNIYYHGDISDKSQDISVYHEWIKTTQKPQKIRYIRDHLSGSNRNTGSYWIDIQAIDNRWVNVAKSKPVFSPHEAYVWRPYSRITDENLSYYSNPIVYGSPTFIVVDLEKQYSLNMLKVWHYYYDRWQWREFKGTKTEISSDGVHWYSIHDSERDSTYVEPKNGEGKTYLLSDDPIKKTCVTHVWNTSFRCKIPLLQADQYRYVFSKEGIATVRDDGKNNIEIIGLKLGKTSLILQQNGKAHYEIDIEVIPVWETYQRTLKKWQIASVQISNAHNYTMSVTNQWIISSKANSKEIQITWVNAWRTYVYLKYKWTLVAKIDITVETTLITLKKVSVYETKYLRLDDARRLIPSVSKEGLVHLYRYRTPILKGLKPGILKVYLRDSNGVHVMTYDVEIKPKPKPIEYNLKFTWWYGNANLYLPDFINNYHISYQWSWIYDNLKKYDKHFWIDIERVWESKIILRDKKYGFDRYIINIVSEPSYQEFTLNETDYVRVWDNDNYDFREQNSSLVRYRTKDGDGYIYGVWVGETEIHISHHKYGLRKIWKVKVLPKPEVQHIYCETEIGKECELQVKNGGYYYSTDIPYGYYDVDSYRRKFEFESELSWQYTAYIKWFYGNYITHVFHINVKPKAAEVSECHIAVGWLCDLGYIQTNSRSLEFRQTNPWLVSLKYTRQSKSGTESKREEYDRWIYDHSYKNIHQWYRYKIKYDLKALRSGTWDIYIYDQGQHLYTVKVNVITISPIALEDTSIKVKQGEKITTKILEWGGKYRAFSDYQDLDYFDTDSDKDENGDYLQTWEVTAKHTQVGRYYPVIADRYNQTKRLKIIVEDADLVLWSYVPNNLKIWEWWNIPVYDRYIRIKSLEEENRKNVLQARYVRDTRDDSEYIRIKWLKNGKTILRVTDQENNVATIKIQIWTGVEDDEGVEEEESEESGGEEESNDNKNYWDLEEILQEIIDSLFSQSDTTIQNNTSSLSQVYKERIDTILKKYINEKWEKAARDLILGIPYIKKKFDSSTWYILDYVSETIEKQLDFRIIHSVTDITHGKIWWIQFQVSNNLQWKMSNVWVQYLDGNWLQKKKELKLQEDGQYIVAFSEDSCKWCTNLEPYYFLSGNTDIFIASNEWSIEVANSAYTQFVNILKSIWFWKWYDKEYNRVANWLDANITDLKEDINSIKSLPADILVDLILQTIAKHSIDWINVKLWGVPTKISIDTLPIAGHLLEKFLNWPRGDIIFSNWHWISQKIKKTSKYNEIKSKIEDMDISSYKYLIEGDMILLLKGSDIFKKTLDSQLELDLYFGVNKFKYEVYITRYEWILHSLIKIEDDYDFPKDADYWEGLWDTLNALWYYSQTKLNWEIYNWESHILEEIK